MAAEINYLVQEKLDCDSEQAAFKIEWAPGTTSIGGDSPLSPIVERSTENSPTQTNDDV